MLCLPPGLVACGVEDTSLARSTQASHGESGSTESTVEWARLPAYGQSIRVPQADLVEQVVIDRDRSTAAARDCLEEAGYQGGGLAYESPRVQAFSLIRRPTSRSSLAEDGLLTTRTRQARFAERGNPLLENEGAASAIPGDLMAKCFREIAEVPIVGELLDSYNSEVLADPWAASAHTKWKECMSREGFAVETVAELVSALDVAQARDLPSYMGSWSSAERDKYDSEQLKVEMSQGQAVLDCDEEAFTVDVIEAWAIKEKAWLEKSGERFESLSARSKAILFGQLPI